MTEIVDDEGRATDSAFVTNLRDTHKFMQNQCKSVNLFVLDNSVRETTVGAIRGHSVETKFRILNAIKNTNIDEIIFGTFGSGESTPDEELVKRWTASGGELHNMWGFTDAWDFDQGGNTWKESIPAGLAKMCTLKMSNAIIEVDTCDPRTFNLAPNVIEERVLETIRNAKRTLQQRGKDSTRPSRLLINLRDFANFENCPRGLDCALRLVAEIGKLPADERPLGIMIEEPTGFLMPLVVAKNVARIRDVMRSSGWKQGKLLVHVHMNFGLADAAILEAIGAGADGFWGAVCRPGAHLGHACSAVVLTNLARMGNRLIKPYVATIKDLLLPPEKLSCSLDNIEDMSVLCSRERYNLPEIVKAARVVHELVTMAPVPPCEEVYGPMSFDLTFHGWHGFCQDAMNEVAKLVGVKPTERVTSFSDVDAIEKAMVERFGTREVGGWSTADGELAEMKSTIKSELLESHRFDYNTPLGLAQLYECARGKISQQMLDCVMRDKAISRRHPLIVVLKTRWFTLTRDKIIKSGKESIYHDVRNMEIEDFLSDVLRAKSSVTKQQLAVAMDINGDRFISWEEFSFRLKWTLLQHGADAFATPEGLIDATFEGIRRRLESKGNSSGDMMPRAGSTCWDGESQYSSTWRW